MNRERMQAPLTGERALAEFERARRHSERVRLLKRALPATGLFIVLAIIVSLVAASLWMPGIDLAGLRVEDGRLVMDNPELNGVDADKRPFNLRADRAMQDAERPERIRLENISAILPMDGEATAELAATNGIYDADAKFLRLENGIAINTTNGMKVRLEDADIDIDKGEIVTDKPAIVDTGRARIHSQRLSVRDGGKVIVFEDQVKMTVMPAEETTVADRERAEQQLDDKVRNVEGREPSGPLGLSLQPVPVEQRKWLNSLSGAVVADREALETARRILLPSALDGE